MLPGIGSLTDVAIAVEFEDEARAVEWEGIDSDMDYW